MKTPDLRLRAFHPQPMRMRTPACLHQILFHVCTVPSSPPMRPLPFCFLSSKQSPLPPKIVVISYLLLADPNPLPQFNLPDSRRPPIKARHRQSLAGGDAKLNLTLARPLACLATASSLDPEHIHSRAHGTLAALLHAPSTPKRMRRATGTQPASSHRSFPQTRAPM